MTITYKRDTENVDWKAMIRAVVADDFHNGRTPAQMRLSFENSASFVIAYDGDRIIGTVRGLSDGVCNAYIVDVWTDSAYRRRGIATAMMRLVLADFEGQHVYLFTDDRVDFYHTLGFREDEIGMAKVVGQWLQNPTRDLVE